MVTLPGTGSWTRKWVVMSSTQGVFFFSDAQSENLLVRPRPGKGLVGFNAS